MTKTLIKNGLVYDGTPNPPRLANLLVDQGQIIALTQTNLPESSLNVIDASGHWVLPGFIDNHTHYDGEVLIAPSLSESVRHGVTTVILGGCSLSFIYSSAEDCCDMFTRVEAFPREILAPILQEKKAWDTPQAWLEHLQTLALGPNIASFIGHSDIRTAVLGLEKALEPNYIPQKSEIAQMENLLHAALDAGFLGVSMQHNPWDKMDGKHWSKLLPATYAHRKERHALTQIVRERKAHLQGVPNLVNRVAALWYMSQSAGYFYRKPLRCSMVAMMNLKGDPYIRPVISGLADFFNRICQADFRMQIFPVPFRVLAQGMELVIFEEFPTGALARHLAKDLQKRNQTLQDPEYRKAFKKHYKNKLAPKIWQKDFGDAYITSAPDPTLIGQSILDIAAARNQDPVDTFLDFVVELDQDLAWETTIGNAEPEKYQPLYNDPHGIFGFADSGAHINNMAFYNFPIRVLAYVQDSIQKGQPLMSIEKAIWRLTKENADFFQIEAGYLAPGRQADLVIVDPQGLTEEVHHFHSAPFMGHHQRLVNRSDQAVKMVMIQGKIAWENAEPSSDFGKSAFGQFLARR